MLSTKYPVSGGSVVPSMLCGEVWRPISPSAGALYSALCGHTVCNGELTGYTELPPSLHNKPIQDGGNADGTN